MKSTNKTETQPCGRCHGTGVEYADEYQDGEIVGRAAVQCPECEGTGREPAQDL